jgi:hypothetical protein
LNKEQAGAGNRIGLVVYGLISIRRMNGIPGSFFSRFSALIAERPARYAGVRPGKRSTGPFA